MPLSINSGGTWRTALNLFVNNNGTWRQIRNAFVNDGGTWRQAYGLARNLAGSQSAAGCYAGQGGFSVDVFTFNSVNAVYLTMGTWPTDPPNCQTCDWTWLNRAGMGNNGLSNNNTSNIFRTANNVRPYWTMLWTLNIDAIPIGNTVETRAPNWPYTIVSYTYRVTKNSNNSISIVPYPNAWSTGDTGTSISVNSWWRNVVLLGGGNPDESGNLGSINYSWTL